MIRVELRNEYGLGAPELYKNEAITGEDPKALLDGVAVSGLVGILRQLGDLAEFAAEVFHGLQEQVTMTSSRSHKLMSRVQHIEAALPSLEKAVLSQKSHLHFAYTAGSYYHPRIHCEKHHFIYSDLPRFVMDSYENCRGPPSLHLLDKFDTNGPGSCLKRYSDPTFFKRASSAKDEKLSKDKKSRRNKKRRSWRKNKEASSASFNGRIYSDVQTSPSRSVSAKDATIKTDQVDHSNSLDSRNGVEYVDSMLEYDFLKENGGVLYDVNNTPEVHSGNGKSRLINETENEQNSNGEAVSVERRADYCMTMDFESDEQNNGKLETIVTNSEAVNSEIVDDEIQCDEQIEDIESETDSFMDALNTIESESETETDNQTKRNSGLINESSNVQETLVNINPEESTSHLDNVASRNESESQSETIQSLCLNTVNPSNIDLNESNDVQSVSDELQKPIPEYSVITPSIQFWTNGGLLGLEPSKPPDFSVLNGLEQGSNVNRDFPDVSSSNYSMSNHDNEETNGFSRWKIARKLPSTDLDVKHQNLSNTNDFGNVAVTPQGSKSFNGLNREEKSVAYRTFSGRTKDFSRDVSPIISPTSSPPLGHMKISFQPIDGTEISKFELKFPNRDNVNNGNGSFRDMFPSFHLVPELSNSHDDINSNSDEDTFCRSSPYTSDDDCVSQPSDSNSEVWESGESSAIKDHELYESLRRISLTESVSTSMETTGDIRADNVVVRSQSAEFFDVPHLDTFTNDLSDDLNNKNLLKLYSFNETTPPPPPLPPMEWRAATPLLEVVEDEQKLSESIIYQQPKMDPLGEDQIVEAASLLRSKEQVVESLSVQKETKRTAYVKETDEKEDFLHQIRTKSFNLRRTATTKPSFQTAPPSSIKVTAILEKANAIRQAVGSDDDNWSDN